MTKQKTWVDLLGPTTENCVVDGRFISRTNKRRDHYYILWTFDTTEQATTAFTTWKSEIEQLTK